MSHPRIEEVSDSDPEIDDPSEFSPNEIIRRVDTPPKTNPTMLQQPPPMSQAPAYREPTEQEVRAKRAELKPYVTLYPIYFSSARTRMSGRRVSKSLASENPLAFNMLKAARTVLGHSIKIAFEPDKTHPKDWANPGRVKVELFDVESGKALHSSIKNKQHLFNLVAKYMKENPTQKEDPLELKLQGLPVPENFLDTKIAVPRGWKMNEVLPIHSAAVTGGGVSDNFFKDAMEEMAAMQGQGGMPGGAPGGMDMGAMAQMMQNMGMGGGGSGGSGGNAIAGSSSSKKKDKKK